MNVLLVDKFKKYGPIVREHFLWNYPIIHLFDKKDIEEVLKYPSKFPIRPELEFQAFYRRSRPDRYVSVGLVSRFVLILRILIKVAIYRCFPD